MRGCCSRRCASSSAGDIVSGKNLPLLDANNGGSGVEYGDTIAKAHSTFTKLADTVVTGHSTNMTLPELHGIRDVQSASSQTRCGRRRRREERRRRREELDDPSEVPGLHRGPGRRVSRDRAGYLRRNRCDQTGEYTPGRTLRQSETRGVREESRSQKSLTSRTCVGGFLILRSSDFLDSADCRTLPTSTLSFCRSSR